MSRSYRVLIVDDHREMRTAFKANLEVIDADLTIIDVPSGEEALLEASSGGIDLLIADIGLPGLSGLELFGKLKQNDPEIKVILVTGQEDEDLLREIADCGADAFFIKPVNIPDLLSEVNRCLGLSIQEEKQLKTIAYEPLDERLTERIEELRGEVGALSVSVLNLNGIIAAQEGNMPDAVYESRVMPRLLDTFQAVNDISGFLGIENPDSSWYFSGIKYDLFWVHINREYGILVITNPIMQNTDLTWVITTVDMAANDALKIIRELPVKAEDADPAVSKTPSLTEKDEEVKEAEPLDGDQKEEVQEREEPEPLPVSQFAKKFSEVVGKDVNEYWEDATLEDEIPSLEDPDNLSYEEARKLGYISGGE